MQISEGSEDNAYQPKLKHLRLPLAIFILGSVIAFFLVKQQAVENQKLIQSNLEVRLEQISGAVVESIAVYQYGLKGLRGAILTTGIEQFDYAHMQTYITSRDMEKEFPGARGFGLIRHIEPQQQANFTQYARQDRPDKSFQIRQFAAHQGSLMVIQYIEPEQNNQQAIGLDIGSELNRRTAAIESAKHNEVRLTAPITLVQASNKVRHGFLILLPIYRPSTELLTPEEKLSTLYGWSYAPILVEEILDSISALKDDTLVSIQDDDLNNADAFYQYGKPDEQSAKYAVSRVVNLFGRNWVLQLTAKQAFIDSLLLPAKYQILLVVMGSTLMLILFTVSIQLALARRWQTLLHKKQLSSATELALRQANSQLENEVSKKVQEIAQVSSLQRSILESAAYAIISTDEKGTITAFNPAAERLLGYAAEELIGQHSPATFHLNDEVVAKAEALSKEFGYTLEPGFEVFVAKARLGKTDSNPWTYVHKNGRHIPVRLTVSSLFDNQGNLFGFLGIAYDLTEQLEHDRVLAEATERAEHANQAKSKFLSNMSHEIRTPLNGIYGSLQIIKKEVTSEQGQDLLGKALYSTKNLNIIINDILDFSKIEAGKLELENCVFNLVELLEHLLSELSVMAASKSIAFHLSNAVEHQHWQGDPTRIRQIMLNIGANAIKFTEHGSVKFDVVFDDLQQQLVFTMQDTGVGMQPEQQQRLFQRFEQADTTTTRKFGGTGLGLSITHSLVGLMGGTISVESEPGVGTSLKVCLPLARASAPEVEQSQQQVDDINFAGKTILVAEDNEINRAIVEAMLAPTQARLVFANNGVEAIDFHNTTSPDVILMDIQMPKMDGIEACKTIKATHPTTPIIALTANAMSDDIKMYESEGFDGHLAKPIELSVLLLKLQQVLLG